MHFIVHSHVPTTWMVPESIMLCEIKQRDNDKIMIPNLYLESKNQNNKSTKQNENTHKCREETRGCQRGQYLGKRDEIDDGDEIGDVDEEKQNSSDKLWGVIYSIKNMINNTVKTFGDRELLD